MRIATVIFVLLSVLLSVTSADARGGKAEDCQPGSTDPDCKE